MTTTDWTPDLLSYGHARNWRPLPQRAVLKHFATATRTERQRGLAAERALRLGYAALARATPEERDACQSWPDVLDLQRRQKQAAKRAAEEEAERLGERVEALRRRRVWVLSGLCLGDQTVSRYTLDELEQWRDWAAYLRYRAPTIYAQALRADGEPELTLDWSIYFTDVIGEATMIGEDMQRIADDLALFTNEQRQRRN